MKRGGGSSKHTNFMAVQKKLNASIRRHLRDIIFKERAKTWIIVVFKKLLPLHGLVKVVLVSLTS